MKIDAHRAATRLVLTIGLAACLAGTASAAGIAFDGKEAKRAPSDAEASAGKTPFFRTEQLACGGGSCFAQISMNPKRITTVTTVSCIVRTSGGQLEAVGVLDGPNTLAILPVASRSVDGTKEAAVVYNTTNLTFTGGTLTLVAATSGTGDPGGGCVLQGTTVKK